MKTDKRDNSTAEESLYPTAGSHSHTACRISRKRRKERTRSEQMLSIVTDYSNKWFEARRRTVYGQATPPPTSRLLYFHSTFSLSLTLCLSLSRPAHRGASSRGMLNHGGQRPTQKEPLTCVGLTSPIGAQVKFQLPHN